MSNYTDLANVLAKAAMSAASNGNTNSSPSGVAEAVAKAAISAATSNLPQTATVDASKRMKADFNDINNLLKNYYGGSFYYGSAIPERKLRNARAAMGIPVSKKIYALYDNTIFGSAKEGACFTDNEIYGRTSSSNEVITYEELTKKTITYSSSGYLRFNDVPTVFSAWFDSLLVKLNRVNAPVDTSKAVEALTHGEYALCIKYLDEEESHVKYTQPKDLFTYQKLYVEANIAMLNMDNAAKLLNTLKRNYGSTPGVAEYIADAEERIEDYLVQYEADRENLNQIIATCERLRGEKKIDEALDMLDRVVLRDDFTKKIKKDYYKCVVSTYLIAERPDDAQSVIDDLYEKEFIDYNEKSSLDGQVHELRETLHQRYLQEQRNLIVKQIATAKMYENHGILESASDTLIAALSSAPDELVVERVNLFKSLVDLLTAQYEYDALYDLSKQYSSITTQDKLSFSLHERVEQHKSGHIEEYFTHLYNSSLYYMQGGKFERAEQYLARAKEIKSTFDLRCSEVNLAILKHDYVESRNLINGLLADRSMYDEDVFDETIEQLEAQYQTMIAAISDMLKAYVLANNTEALLANNGYAEFVDKDGLNLSCIAARFANHEVLDLLEETGCGYEFRRTNEGFGIAFLAAMQMDYDAFAKFINARMDSYDGDINCVLNEQMDYSFGVSEVVRELRTSRGLGEQEARRIAIEAAFNETVFFIASLLDEATREEIVDRLAARKQVQEGKVGLMRNALPDQFQKIDEETVSHCDSLKAATAGMKALLADVPEDDDETNVELAMGELQDAVSSIVELAKENAGKKKAALKTALETEEKFVGSIQSCLDVFAAIDTSEVVSLLAVPAAAIQVWEYDEDTHSMAFTLMGQHTTVELSAELATAISSNSEKLQTNQDIDFVFENNTLTVKYGYAYSSGADSCSVVFEKAFAIDSSFTADKFIERILGMSKF